MIREKLRQFVEEAIYANWDREDLGDLDIKIDVEERPAFGDYATNVAFAASKKVGTTSLSFAEKLVPYLNENKIPEVEKIEFVAPGFINFYLSPTLLQQQVGLISGDENYGLGDSLKNKTVMVEFTDPNPFKLFHIGHLMSNAIGESISRLYEASGAKVIRANYQGDKGLHVAKAIYGTQQIIKENDSGDIKRGILLGLGYSKGSQAFENDEQARKEIEEINRKIYDRSNPEINELYDLGRKWSLDYFEEIYKKLGTKFDNYFFESETGKDGLDVINQNKQIFIESEGTTIFKGEDYGLHTRVFISSKGLPTYEAKELGLNKKKFELYPLDLSVVITGNEINDYFKVLLKVMSLIMPEVAEKTRHVSHGMLRLPSGKMSSRTGDVITAEALIEQTKERVEAIARQGEKSAGDTDASDTEAIAIGAIKYSILKQSLGKDIIFDFDKSLSLEGDSGPYVQYAYARLKSILSSAGDISPEGVDYGQLTHETELNLIRHLLWFPDVVKESSDNLSPNHLVLYVYKLANAVNNFYEKVHILNDENKDRMAARLALVEAVAKVLASGLDILGIKVLEKI